LAVSGVESAPISIEPSESKLWETTVAGKLQIPLKLIRRADFNANLKLKAIGISALDKLKEIEVDGKATNATWRSISRSTRFRPEPTVSICKPRLRANIATIPKPPKRPRKSQAS